MNRHIDETPGDQFYSPFTKVLIKGDEADGKWNVYLQASNEGLDQDEEVLLCKALKDAADYYLTHGVLSWDHKHKVLHDPKYIIGEPVDVAFTGNNETMVKGFLYKENEVAQGLWKNIMSGAKMLGASVGGGILQKAKDAAEGVKGVISKVVWDETAVTHKPVNDGTLGMVSIVPFPVFAKALMAGSGVNAEMFTGGRALTPESLQGSGVENILHNEGSTIPYGETRRIFDDLLVRIKGGGISSYNDVVSYITAQGYPNEVTAQLLQFLQKKLPEIKVYFGG